MFTNTQLWLLILLPAAVLCIQASLTVISFTPICLNLTFSDETPLPPFQLVYNEMPTPYSVEQSTESNLTYIINVDTNSLPSCPDCLGQKYVVLFTEPLGIEQQDISKFMLNSFALRAQKVGNISDYLFMPIGERGSLFGFQSHSTGMSWLAVAICTMAVTISYASDIGLHCFNFIITYVYMSIKSKLFTSLAYKIAFYFLFDIHQAYIQESPSKYTVNMLYIFAPHIMLLVSGAIGMLVRVFLWKLIYRGVFLRGLFYFFGFRAVIVTWQLVCAPLVITTTHVLFDVQEQYQGLRYVIVYTNLLMIVGFGYMAYFACNPHISESSASWITYTQTLHFKMFNAFHMGTKMHSIFPRNCKLVTYVGTVLPMMTMSISSSMVPNLYAQSIVFVYLFVTHPFQYGFLNNFYMTMQGVSVSLFFYRYVIDQYLRISSDLVTSTATSKILLVNISITCTLMVVYSLLAAYQLYQRIQRARKNQRIIWESLIFDESAQIKQKQPLLTIYSAYTPRRTEKVQGVQLKEIGKSNDCDSNLKRKSFRVPKIEVTRMPSPSSSQSSPDRNSPRRKIGNGSGRKGDISGRSGTMGDGSGRRKEGGSGKRRRRLETKQGSWKRQKQKQSLLQSISMEPESTK